MSPLLFAAALALSSPTPDASAPSPILKDLPSATAQTPLDAPAKPPLLRDLRGPEDSAQGSVRTWVLPLGAMPPPGSLSRQERDRLAFEGKLCQRKTVQTLGPDHSTLKKLGELPPGLLEHAVNRIVDGCPVREIVSDGGTYYLDVAGPTLERLDPVARVTKPLAGGR
jgi:hypothetical protein